MQNVFVYWSLAPVRACVYVDGSSCGYQGAMGLIATDDSVQLIALEQSQTLGLLEWKHHDVAIKPVQMARLSSLEGECPLQYFLQSRNGWLLGLGISCKLQLQLLRKHRISHEGFSRVALLTVDGSSHPSYYYFFDEDKQLLLRESVRGQETTGFEVDEEDRVSHITDMVAVSREGTENVFVMVEGGRILHYTVAINKITPFRLVRCYQLPSASQPAIILSGAALGRWVFCAVRGDSVYRLDTTSGDISAVQGQGGSTRSCTRHLRVHQQKLYGVNSRSMYEIEAETLRPKELLQLDTNNSLINDVSIGGGLLLVGTEANQLIVCCLQQ